MNIFQKIKEFIAEYSEDELKDMYCILSFFDAECNLSLFFCKKVNGKYKCGGHICFCTLEETKNQSLFDLYELKSFLKNFGIELIVDFEWFLKS